MARRLLLAIIFLPPGFGATCALLESFVTVNQHLMETLVVIASLASIFLIGWTTAVRLDSSDLEARESMQRLRRSESLLTGVLNLVPVGIWTSDAEGNVIQDKPAARSIWGGAHRHIRELCQDIVEDQKRGSKAFTQIDLEGVLQKKQSINDRTLEIKCFDGSRKIVSHSAVPFLSESGEVLGALVTNYDITRRQHLEDNAEIVAKAGEKFIKLHSLEATLKSVVELATTWFCDSALIFLLDEKGSPVLSHESFRDHKRAMQFRDIVHQHAPNRDSDFGIMQVIRTRKSILTPKINIDIARSGTEDTSYIAL